MRRTLTLRRDTLADLTPADLAAVAGAQRDSIACGTTDCIAEIKSPSEILAAVVATVCACPWSRGC